MAFEDWEKITAYRDNSYVVQSLGSGQYRIREVSELWGKRHNRQSDGQEVMTYQYYVLTHDSNVRLWEHQNKGIVGVYHFDVDNWRIVHPSQAMHMTKAQILEHMVREELNDWVA
jgi:hypothetical protein